MDSHLRKWAAYEARIPALIDVLHIVLCARLRSLQCIQLLGNHKVSVMPTHPSHTQTLRPIHVCTCAKLQNSTAVLPLQFGMSIWPHQGHSCEPKSFYALLKKSRALIPSKFAGDPSAPACCGVQAQAAPRPVSFRYAAEKSLKKRCWSFAYASMMVRHSGSSAITCVQRTRCQSSITSPQDVPCARQHRCSVAPADPQTGEVGQLTAASCCFRSCSLSGGRAAGSGGIAGTVQAAAQVVTLSEGSPIMAAMESLGAPAHGFCCSAV